MLRLVLSPQWFLTPDILIDIFSFLVLLTFTIISLRYYKMSKNKNFKYLGLSFLLICLGEFFEIIMNLNLYYDFVSTYNFGQIIVTSHVIKPLEIINYIGFFLHRLSIMLGFYFLYYTTKKDKNKADNVLMLFLILVIAIITGSAYHFFHMVVAMFVALTFLNYSRIYKDTKSKNTRVLTIAFLILLISYITMIFVTVNSTIYILSNILQLAAYVSLLYLIIRIYRHGKRIKKK